MSESIVRNPSWDQIKHTFHKHIEHYLSKEGEDILRDRSQEASIEAQYAGRVIYELFQNAIDRANKKITISFRDGILLIGNDGTPLSIAPDHSYKQVTAGKLRSDFHALCSINTSNKNPNENYGNKGIGFRSVFSISDQVQIWSRFHKPNIINDEKFLWWGFELLFGGTPHTWKGSALPELDTRIRNLDLSMETRPSYYFPRLLCSELPFKNTEFLDDIQTLICVQVHPKHHEQIDNEIKNLAKTRLQFVHNFRKMQGKAQCNMWIDNQHIPSPNWELFPTIDASDLISLAKEALYPIETPKCAIAWPQNTINKEMGLFYNYFPTQATTGLPIDIHADFIVKADRQNMDVDANNPRGRYNRALLKKAAMGLLAIVEQELQKDSPRIDLWDFLMPPKDSKAWRIVLRDCLFSSRNLLDWSRWVDFADLFFRNKQYEESVYGRFWEACTSWLEETDTYKTKSKQIKANAQPLCKALSERNIPLIPVKLIENSHGVSTQTTVHAVALPKKLNKQQYERMIFLRSAQEEDIQIPTALLQKKRSVSNFPIHHIIKKYGLFSEFRLDSVLTELNQSNPKTEEPLPQDLLEKRFEEQWEILIFAHKQRPNQKRTEHFAWRTFRDDNPRRMGRSLSSLFVPMHNGKWAPACQLNLNDVDCERIQNKLSIAPEEAKNFLHWLGVAFDGATPLLEGGLHGQIEPRDFPPPLSQAKRSNIPIRPLLPLIDPVNPPSIESVLKSVENLPDDREKVSSVFSYLRTQPWISNSCVTVKTVTNGKIPEYYSPNIVFVRTQSNIRYKIFPVLTQEYPGYLKTLEKIGFILERDSEKTAKNASNLLHSLHKRYPTPNSTLTPTEKGFLKGSYESLLLREGQKETYEKIPLLYEQEGSLQWHDLEDEKTIYICRLKHRSDVQRYYPELPLACVQHSPHLPKRLGVTDLMLQHKVCSDTLSTSQDFVKKLYHAVTNHLATFCAMADAHGRVVDIDVPYLQHAWKEENIQQVEDAWIEMSFKGLPQLGTKTLGKKEFNDVFYIPRGNSNDRQPGEIVFDVDSNKDLPLSYFGRALAELLIRQQTDGPLFSEILTAIQANRVEDYIKHHRLGERQKEWLQKLQAFTLNEASKNAILHNLTSLCTNPDEVFQKRLLCGEDLKESARTNNKIVQDLEKILHNGIPVEDLVFCPKVCIREQNLDSWKRWCKRYKKQLRLWLSMESELSEEDQEDILQHLDTRANGMDLLQFDLETHLLSILSQYNLSPETIKLIENYENTSFKTVEQPPLTLHSDTVQWSAAIGKEARSKGGPEGKIDPKQVFEENKARSLWGDEAERAFLSWVVQNTAPLLKEKGAVDTLLSVFSKTSKTKRIVEQHLKNNHLKQALYIAQLWSGAGFDILGLERNEKKQIIPVRYECKGLPKNTERKYVRIYLSRRELAVAKDVFRNQSQGKWKLIGIQDDGIPIDFSELVSPLIDDRNGILSNLYNLGIEPDGYKLVIERRQ